MDKINENMTLKQTVQTIENILPVLDGMMAKKFGVCGKEDLK